MNRPDPMRLTAVTPLPDQRLTLTFADGFIATVDLSGWIAGSTVLARLAVADTFARAHVGEWGHTVAWFDDDLELGADNLRNLAVEQAGGIGWERLLAWLHRTGLTQAQAAEAIGISRRMLNYYLSGAKSIPKTVWLACLGWEAQPGARGRTVAKVADDDGRPNVAAYAG